MSQNLKYLAFINMFGSLACVWLDLLENRDDLQCFNFSTCSNDVEVYSRERQYFVTSLLGVVTGANEHTSEHTGETDLKLAPREHCKTAWCEVTL